MAMDSLSITGLISLSGGGTGSLAHPDNTAPMFLNVVAALSSTDTGAAKATQALFYRDRTLSGLTSETFDLTSFSDALEQAGTLTKVRIVAIYHSSESVATTGIRVGGGIPPFQGSRSTASNTNIYKPGEGVIEISATSDGWGVTASMGLQIANLSSDTATYTIGVFGE